MSFGQLSRSRKHLFTPPINKDRVKRLRGLWDDSNSRNVSQEGWRDHCLHNQGKRDDDQGNGKATGSFRKQAQQPAARIYDSDAIVQLEISSTWHFRFKGNCDSLLTTLNTLPYLEAALSSKT